MDELSIASSDLNTGLSDLAYLFSTTNNAAIAFYFYHVVVATTLTLEPLLL